jgi:hypothetical protein
MSWRPGYQLHILRLSNEGVPVHPLARRKGLVPKTIKPVLSQFIIHCVKSDPERLAFRIIRFNQREPVFSFPSRLLKSRPFFLEEE